MSGARYRWERLFMEHSGLPSPSRLIGLTLATMTDPNLTIPEKFAPSWSTLQKLTGLSRGAVSKHLKELEGAGWIRRVPPTTAAALSRRDKNRYALLVPVGVPVENKPGTQFTTWTSSRDEREPVHEVDLTSSRAEHRPAPSSTSTSTSDAGASAPRSRAEASADPEEVLDGMRADFGGLSPAEEQAARPMVERGEPRQKIANLIAAGRPAEGSRHPEPAGAGASRDGDPWAPPGPSMPGGGPW